MIKVISPGLFSTIQDLGRIGYSRYGVPISGAMDTYASSLANHILQNNTNDAVIEITFGKTILEFLEPTIICISGGNFSPKINNKSIPQNTPIVIHKSDVLSFGKRKFGYRTYLAVKGGIQSEVVMKSRSFFKNITLQDRLHKKDQIPFKPFEEKFKIVNTSVKTNRTFFEQQKIDCFVGPEFERLTNNQKENLFSHTFSISNNNSRMGYQLEERISNTLPPIITSSVLPGTVQLTPSGKLIILMRDCQVTGGYPRVLQLPDLGIAMVSQKITGQKLKFALKKE